MDTQNLKAVFLVGTLKATPLSSHTQVLSEFLAQKLEKYNVESEFIRLADYDIKPGIEDDMGNGDEWPTILEKLVASDIIILSTPIWWGTYSSLIQRAVERMDHVRGPEFYSTGKSPFSNKVGGMVVTGGSDGAEFVIGHLAMFMSWSGLTIPPACSVSVLSGVNFEDKSDAELIEAYKKDSEGVAEVTAANLATTARLLKMNQVYPSIK